MAVFCFTLLEPGTGFVRYYISLAFSRKTANINVKNCRFSERSLFAVARPSVVCLSVCNARAPYSGGCKLRQFLRHLLPSPSVDMGRKFYGDRPRGTPPSGALNATGVAKYSDFGRNEGYISETV